MKVIGRINMLDDLTKERKQSLTMLIRNYEVPLSLSSIVALHEMSKKWENFYKPSHINNMGIHYDSGGLSQFENSSNYVSSLRQISRSHTELDFYRCNFLLFSSNEISLSSFTTVYNL